METKKWYQSKTLLANTVLVLGVAVQVLTNTQIMDPEIQAGLIAVINLGLRVITKSGLN